MNTISAISFYDALNKLTVGVLLLLPFIPLAPSHPETVYRSPLFYIVAFLIGCLYQLIIKNLTPCLTNNLGLIRRAHMKVQQSLSTSPKENKEEITKEEYLKAYYEVAQNGLLMNIPILEALENFFRNMLPILLLYLVLLLARCSNVITLLEIFGESCRCTIFLFFFIFADAWLWYETQSKIHYLVWEGSSYCLKEKQS